jgi:hypothetical protein
VVKSIPLKTLPGDKSMAELSYAQILAEVVRRPLNSQAGASIEEMRQSIRVLDELETSNGVLELEDADYEHLKSKILAMPWGVIDRRIVQLVDDVLSAS